MTVSPRTNSLLMYRSLLTGFDFFLPLPDLGLGRGDNGNRRMVAGTSAG